MECHLLKVTVHYETFGQGKPIIMIHGKGFDHRHMVASFEPFFPLHLGWRRFYPDLPGHGRTQGSDWIKGNDEMLEVVIDFIDKVTQGRRFALVGCSYGGYLARGVVNRISAQIEGLLLWIPAITYGTRHLPSHVAPAEDSGLASRLTSEFEEEMNTSVAVQSKKSLDYFNAYLRPAWENADHKFIESRTGNGFSFDRDGFPEGLKTPTLIVCGRQDSVVGYADAYRIIENYPKATFAILDRAGHLLGAPGEQEEVFKALVNDWLDRVEGQFRVHLSDTDHEPVNLRYNQD